MCGIATNRRMISAVFVLALAGSLLWISIRNTPEEDFSVSNNDDASRAPILPEKNSSPKNAEEGLIFDKDDLPSASGESDADSSAISSSEIESILSDTALSFEESATRLLECTRREDLPMEVRLDALDHAFNLDRWQAMTLCMEKPLAKPIAERLLSGIHNHGEAPKDQASACMHLMLHDDAEIREQAQELLAFLISAEEHASDPEKLREAADAFLKQTEEGDAEQGADADSE